MCINSFLYTFLLRKFQFSSVIDFVQFNVILVLCKIPLISRLGGLSWCSATMYLGKMIHEGELLVCSKAA